MCTVDTTRLVDENIVNLKVRSKKKKFNVACLCPKNPRIYVYIKRYTSKKKKKIYTVVLWLYLLGFVIFFSLLLFKPALYLKADNTHYFNGFESRGFRAQRDIVVYSYLIHNRYRLFAKLADPFFLWKKKKKYSPSKAVFRYSNFYRIRIT